MRKILIGIVLCILALIIGCWIWIYNRQSQSQRAHVHPESTFLIDISVDEVLRDMSWNALANPSYYLKDSTGFSKGDQKISLWNMGWKIPSHLYFFNIPSDPHTLFAIQKITDVEKFEVFLKENLGLQLDSTFRQGEFKVVKSKNQLLTILFDQTTMAVAISRKTNDQSQKLAHLLRHPQGLVAIADFKLADTLVAGDISVIDLKDQSYVHVFFEKGKIQLKGYLKHSLWHAPKKTSVLRALDTTKALSFYFNADIRRLLERYKSDLDQKGIPTDTLMNYFGGYLDAHIDKQMLLQEDTIVTYELDDNFELSPRRTIQQTEVPNMQFAIRASSHLKNYLPEKMYYRFNKSQFEDFILLSTDPKANLIVNKVESPFYFQMHLVPSKLHLPFMEDYLTPLSKFTEINMQMQQLTPGETILKGELGMKEKSIYALYQWL